MSTQDLLSEMRGQPAGQVAPPKPGEFIYYCEPDVKPDMFDRVQFFAFWHADYIPGSDGNIRGQVFHADLSAHVGRDRDNGMTVHLTHVWPEWMPRRH